MPWTRSAATRTLVLPHARGRRRRSTASRIDAPVTELTQAQLNVVLYGDAGADHRQLSTARGGHHEQLGHEVRGRHHQPAAPLQGDRLRLHAQRVRALHGDASPARPARAPASSPSRSPSPVGDKNITEIDGAEHPRGAAVVRAPRRADDTPLNEREQTIAYQILKEIRARLDFLVDVGLDYLTLDRGTATLSGGEAQRIRLATQIGSGLMGVLYVCDEPTHRPAPGRRRAPDPDARAPARPRQHGAHRRARRVDDARRRLPHRHGPRRRRARRRASSSQGTPDEVMADPKSLTGAYLSRPPPDPDARDAPAPATARSIKIRGARENNLKNIDVDIPLGKFVCVTGVSGSGKSTLITEILYKKAAQVLYSARDRPGEHDSIDGPRAARQGHQHRPVADRPHAALEPGDLHRHVHDRSASCSRRCRRRGCAATSRAASPSTSRAAAARPARATATSRSRCSSCPTSPCPARSARASATTARRSRSSSGARTSPKCSR